MYVYIQEKNMFELIQELNKINETLEFVNKSLNVISVIKEEDWIYAVCKTEWTNKNNNNKGVINENRTRNLF